MVNSSCFKTYFSNYVKFFHTLFHTLLKCVFCLVRQDSSHTIGVEFGSKVVNVGGKSVKLQIWDTVGDC